LDKMKKYMPKKKEMQMDYGYDQCYPMHHGGYGYDGYCEHGGYGWGFTIIVVLFILLIIVGCTCIGGKDKD
jgi:uncharacterized protein (TIGR01732 family)